MLSLIIIDDEPLELAMLGRLSIWSELGITVSGSFSDSTKALDFLKESAVDIVLSDIKMPKVTGLDIVKYCSENLPDTSVVLISAYRDFEFMRTALRYHAVDYITKPIDLDELKSVMVKLSDKITSTKRNIDFCDTDFYMSIQAILSDFLLDGPSSKNDINTQLSGFNLPEFSEDACCAFLRFSITCDMDLFFQTDWKHGKLRFYNALMYLIPFKSDDCLHILINCDNQSIDFMFFSTLDYDSFKSAAADHANDIITNALELFNLTLNRTRLNTYQSLTDFFRSENKNDESDTQYSEIIKKAIAYIDSHLSDDTSSDAVASYVSLNSVYFRSLFKHCMGETFIAYLTRRRLETACKLLLETDLKINAICNMIGYKNRTHFYKLFKNYYGKTPNEFRGAAEDGE